MKYFLIAVIFFHSFCTQIYSQAKLSLGIKAGTNTPGLGINSSDPVIDGYKTILEPYFGVVLETGLNKKWSILSEFNYASIGITKDGSQIVPQSTYSRYEFGTLVLPTHVYANFYSKITLNYLELPWMLKYYIYNNKKVNFFVNAGPSIGILLNAQVKTTGKGMIFSDVEHTKPIASINFPFNKQLEITDWFTPVNLEFQGGAGFTYQIPKGEFFANLNGNIGLFKIQTNSGDGSNNTKAITLSIGYLYHIWE